jgi:hypothetical protein
MRILLDWKRAFEARFNGTPRIIQPLAVKQEVRIAGEVHKSLPAQTALTHSPRPVNCSHAQAMAATMGGANGLGGGAFLHAPGDPRAVSQAATAFPAQQQTQPGASGDNGLLQTMYGMQGGALQGAAGGQVAYRAAPLVRGTGLQCVETWHTTVCCVFS